MTCPCCWITTGASHWPTCGRARLEETTIELLARYHWPGNVRELQNLTATLAVRALTRGRARPSDLPLHVTTTTGVPTTL